MVARPIRLLSSGGEGHAARLAGHLRILQNEGAVVFVTADRPFAAWSGALAAAGVDLERLAVVDVVSTQGGLRPAVPPRNVVFLASPTMLEMVSLRIEQHAARLSAHHVLIDSINTLALYNGVPSTQAFVHYLVNRLRGLSLGGDLVLRDDQDGRLLHERIIGFVDSSLTIPGAPLP